MPEPPPPAPDSAAPATLWSTGYAFFLINLAAATLAIQIQNTVVGYQIYELTKDPLALGLVGLAEAIPFLSLVLFGGHIADRLDRRRVLLIAFSVMIAAALALFVLSRQVDRLGSGVLKISVYSLIAVTGVCRSFIQPSRAALGAQLAPRHLAAKAVALRTGLFQLCAVLGPALGGLFLALWGAEGGYAVTAVLLAVASVVLLRLSLPARVALTHRPPLWTSLGEGINYLRRDDLLRGAIVLDLFAVLFGGAVALLPVFANDILKVGAHGFGVLRAAPAAGALIASVILALSPPLRRAGFVLYVSVAGFGACMVGFALSRSFWLSLLLLAASGAFDMVSVLIRSTLMQVRVPDEMMGRVASINQIFVGSSNEIGAFESGLAAKLLGVVPSVVIGGIATLVVVAISAIRSPKLRGLDSLT
ncbi:MAG TPA: MFS transporter [Polyangia bacterium]